MINVYEQNLAHHLGHTLSNLEIIIVKNNRGRWENAGTVGIYLCNFQWIMKLNNFEYVILLITKYIYLISFSHSD